MVVTVQGEDQKPEEIAELCTMLGLTHFHLSIENASVFKLENVMKNRTSLRALISRLEELIKHLTENQETVLVHC